MKRIVSLVLVVLILVTVAFSVCSCGKVECALCKEEVSSMSAKKADVYGQEVTVCKDCYKQMQELAEKLG